MAWTIQANFGFSGTTNPAGPLGGPMNTVGCTVLIVAVTSGAGGGLGTITVSPGVWTPLGAATNSGDGAFLFGQANPAQDPAFPLRVESSQPITRVQVNCFGMGGALAAFGAAETAVATAQAVALPAVALAATSFLVTVASHRDPVGATVAAPGSTTILQNTNPYVAGTFPGMAAFLRTPTGAGSVTCTLTSASVVAPMAGVVAVINEAPPVVPPFTGLGPIANLLGKVNGSNQLLVSIASLGDDPLTARVESDTALTDAVLIPAPPPGSRVVVTQFSASALVAGAFRVRLTTGGVSTLGPFWLPGVGPVGSPSARNFSTGPIARPLPPGQGLALSTSAAAPQAFDVAYVLVPEGA